MDVSVDVIIHKVNNEEDHEPIIVTLPDPRSKVTTSQENNEVDCQESIGDASDGAEDTLLDQPKMTTRSKSRNDNNPVTIVEPETEHIPTREDLRNNIGKDSTWGHGMKMSFKTHSSQMKSNGLETSENLRKRKIMRRNVSSRK